MAQELAIVFTRATAARAGYSAGRIERRIASGAWLRLRRGVFVESSRLGRAVDARQLDLMRCLTDIAAAVEVAQHPVWVAGSSGRRLHGLPEAARAGDVVRLVCEPNHSNQQQYPGLVISPVSVPMSHRVSMHRLPALSAARLVADALRAEPFAESLMIGDQAIRRGKTSRAELADVLADCKGWPGIVQARARSRLLDPRRETPLESASVAMFVEGGIPVPEPQVEVWSNGRLLGRADFGWLDHRVLGEADGKQKYVEDLPGAAPRDERLWKQHLRQADFEDEGFEVVRWTDFERRNRPAAVCRRVRAAFDRAERLGYTSKR